MSARCGPRDRAPNLRSARLLFGDVPVLCSHRQPKQYDTWQHYKSEHQP